MHISRSSLPARERGSKQNTYADAGRVEQSLPARERGSKRLSWLWALAGKMSLPARERGSKHEFGSPEVGIPPVAPRAGARIETPSNYQSWLNTASLPARERGSKQDSFELLM